MPLELEDLSKDREKVNEEMAQAEKLLEKLKEEKKDLQSEKDRVSGEHKHAKELLKKLEEEVANAKEEKNRVESRAFQNGDTPKSSPTPRPPSPPAKTEPSAAADDEAPREPLEGLRARGRALRDPQEVSAAQTRKPPAQVRLAERQETRRVHRRHARVRRRTPSVALCTSRGIDIPDRPEPRHCRARRCVGG